MAELKFPPEPFKASHYEEICGLHAHQRGSPLLKAGAIAFAAAIAVAPAFGQRGSAPRSSGGGGGGSSAGAGSSGGSSWGGGSRSSGGGYGGGQRSSGGGGGSRSTGGSRGGGSARSGSSGGRGSSGEYRGGGNSRGSSGRARGSRTGPHGYTPGARRGPSGFEPSGATRTDRVNEPRRTGFRAALRRFFGLRDSAPRRDELADSSVRTSTDAFVVRALEEAKLPPAFDRMRLRDVPAEFRTPRLATGQASLATPRSDLRHRRVPPFPRPGPPVVIYGWGYWPSYWYEFPVFFDFDYWGPSGYRQYNSVAAPAMLLYLTDGSALEVTDYWVQGVTLFYVTETGKKGHVPVSDVDVQRTVDANKRLGFDFRLDRTQPGLPLDRIEPNPPPAQTSEPNSSSSPQS